jgi:hypothetical protein
LEYKQKYLNDLTKVLQGNVPKRDTTQLDIPKVENSDD